MSINAHATTAMSRTASGLALPTPPTGRNTAPPTTAGGVARKVLGPGITIRGALVQVGPHAIDRAAWDWAQVEQNPFWCPDTGMAAQWADFIDGKRKAG